MPYRTVNINPSQGKRRQHRKLSTRASNGIQSNDYRANIVEDRAGNSSNGQILLQRLTLGLLSSFFNTCTSVYRISEEQIAAQEWQFLWHRVSRTWRLLCASDIVIRDRCLSVCILIPSWPLWCSTLTYVATLDIVFVVVVPYFVLCLCHWFVQTWIPSPKEFWKITALL